MLEELREKERRTKVGNEQGNQNDQTTNDKGQTVHKTTAKKR